MVFSTIVVAVMVGLRFNVGCDWHTYNFLLGQMGKLDFSEILSWSKGDPAYTFLNWAATQAGFTIWAVNLPCAIVFAWGLTSLCRTQPNPELALLVAFPYLVIVVAMGYTRQGAALGFVMYGMSQLEGGSYLRITASALAAAAFHKSAIMVLPFFLLAMSRGGSVGLLFPLIAAVIGYRFFLAGSIDMFMQSYVARSYESVGALPRLLMNIPPAALCLGFLKRFRFEPRSRIFWAAFSVAAFLALAALFLTSSSTAVDRIALYLIPLQIVILARLPSAFGTPTKQNFGLVLMVAVYSLIIEVVWLVFSRYGYCWLPYRIFSVTELLA